MVTITIAIAIVVAITIAILSADIVILLLVLTIPSSLAVRKVVGIAMAITTIDMIAICMNDHMGDSHQHNGHHSDYQHVLLSLSATIMIIAICHYHDYRYLQLSLQQLSSVVGRHISLITAGITANNNRVAD